jgi:hypothetical protein
MEPKPWPGATTFNDWYSDMADSPVKDEIVQRHLGLPPALLSSSLLGWEGIGEITEALRLSAGGTLLDLACGRVDTAWRLPRAPAPRSSGSTFLPRP